MPNQRTSAGTAADKDTQPIVNSLADIEANPMLYAVARKIVMEYWVAELPTGEKVSLKTNDVAWLDIKDGQPVNGKVIEKEVQDKYADGSYARSYSVHKWFEVESNCI